MNSKKQRPVRIVLGADKVILLAYADRKRGQWHHAAQFDSRYTSMEEVLHWLAGRPDLILMQENHA